jgi:hypothetical protein
VTSLQQDFEVQYHTIVSGLKDLGVDSVLSEMSHLNPDLYFQVERYFRFKEIDRKLGVLLDANLSRRTGP